MQAIYARQSVDKKDSISIESQIEMCRGKSNTTASVEIFADRGISGKSTENRPEFQRMMAEVRRGNISKVVIYKFDRITRSLLDFLHMREEFSKYGVELISCSEDFDTSSIMGKAVLNILMSFAEMERETIQQRTTDNYYARGEKGFYLGGYAPFGYNKIETFLLGKKTCTFEENTEESHVLKQIYYEYIDGKSLGEITRWLNNSNIPTRRGKPWSATHVARTLRNPVYVKANADIYHYLASLGGTLNNPIEDYMGENGCCVYGKPAERTGSKFTNLKNDYVTIGLHKGIIDSSTWLAVQHIFTKKQNHSNLGTGSLSWLQGLVKCSCGYTYYIKRCRNNPKIEYRYFYCRGRRFDACPYPRKMMNVEKIENIVEEELLLRLQSMRCGEQSYVVKDTPEINMLKIQLANVDIKINNLIEQIAEGSSIAVQYLNQHIEKLNTERISILDEITKLELRASKTRQMSVDIDDVLNDWKGYDLETKKKIAKEVIDKIMLEDETVSIVFY